MIDSFRVDRLNVYVFESRRQMGGAAAAAVVAEMRRLIAETARAIGIFAAAPSQREFLAALVEDRSVEWTRVIGFHLNEYLGMDEDAPQSLRRFLIERLVTRVPMAEFHGLRGEAANPEAVCANYTALLKSRPPDFAALDLEENGRLAFNAPPVCDFNDPAMVKIVELDEMCRQRQVNDGAFAGIEAAPRRALTLTIPAIVACPRLFVIASGASKQRAVREAVEGEIRQACPASILRTHEDAHLFLDSDSAAKLAR